MRDRSLSSLYFFTKVVMGYKDLIPSLHLPLTTALANQEIRKRGILYPRGHFKSSCIKAYMLWRYLHNHNVRLLNVGESDAVGTKNLIDIAYTVENNQLFRWLFPEAIPPDLNKTTWNDSALLLPRDTTFDEPTFTGVGRGAKGTGFHYDEIIYDDIIGLEDSKSEAKMRDAIEWLRYAPGLLHDQRTSMETFVGTRWKHGNADVYGWVMENISEVQWYIRSAIEEGEVIFPERFSLPILEKIRVREGTYRFSCQYLNHPTPPEGGDFQESWIQTFTVGSDNFTITPNNGTSSTTLKSLFRVSFYDPASGGQTGKAESAVAVVGMDHLRRIFVLDMWSKNCSMGEAIERWHVLNDQYVCFDNKFEDFGIQKVVGEVVLERLGQTKCRQCERAHRRLRPVGFRPPGGRGGTSKEERIRAYLQVPMQEKRVFINIKCQKLISQLLCFPHGSLVDELDAFAYTISQLRAPASVEEHMTAKAEQEAMVAASPGSFSHTERVYGGYAG